MYSPFQKVVLPCMSAMQNSEVYEPRKNQRSGKTPRSSRKFHTANVADNENNFYRFFMHRPVPATSLFPCNVSRDGRNALLSALLNFSSITTRLQQNEMVHASHHSILLVKLHRMISGLPYSPKQQSFARLVNFNVIRGVQLFETDYIKMFF